MKLVQIDRKHTHYSPSNCHWDSGTVKSQYLQIASALFLMALNQVVSQDTNKSFQYVHQGKNPIECHLPHYEILKLWLYMSKSISIR